MVLPGASSQVISRTSRWIVRTEPAAAALRRGSSATPAPKAAAPRPTRPEAWRNSRREVIRSSSRSSGGRGFGQEPAQVGAEALHRLWLSRQVIGADTRGPIHQDGAGAVHDEALGAVASPRRCRPESKRLVA